MSWRSRSVPPIWLAALAGAILVGVFAGDRFLTWIPVAVAVCALLTFVVQLSLQRKEGYVNRVIASIGGSLLILGGATVVLVLLHPESLSRLIA